MERRRPGGNRGHEAPQSSEEAAINGSAAVPAPNRVAQSVSDDGPLHTE
jgi:hypothetical protein